MRSRFVLVIVALLLASFAHAEMGDLDADGMVDLKDLLLVSKDYGRTSGFQAGADTNNDGRVNVFDLVAVAQRLGTHYHRLLLRYPFDQGSGGVARDSGPNGADGAITDPGWTTGVNGSALLFNGSTLVDVPLNEPSGEFTLAFWARFDNVTDGQIVHGLASRGDDWSVVQTNAGGSISQNNVRLAASHNGNTNFTGWIVPYGVWTHVAVTFNGTHNIWYVNGQAKQVTANVPWTSTQPLRLGIGSERGRAGSFIGALDDLRLYEGVLSSVKLSGLAGEGPVCVAEPEICDNLDNDCDGLIDEGAKNACGQCGPLPEEVCDSMDNDCDGLVDEGCPGSGGTEGLLFYDNFEPYTTEAKVVGAGSPAFTWGSSRSTTITDAIAHTGEKSLAFYYGPLGGTGHLWAEQRFQHTPLQEYWVEYYAYFPNGSDGFNRFEHDRPTNSNNIKYYTFWADDYQGKPRGTFQLWSKGDVERDSKINVGRTEGDSNNLVLYPSTNNGGDMVVGDQDRGRWIRTRIHMKVANLDTYNGEIQLWKDDELLVDVKNDPFWDTDRVNNYLERGYLFGWDNNHFDQDTTVFIDDFKMLTSDPGW